MSTALLSLRAGLSPPPLPPDWQGGTGASPPPASVPDPVQPATPAPAADTEMLREFHAESAELLQNIEQGVLVLESNPADQDTINTIFRAFHTFKGSAGFLQLDAMRDLSHELETLLDSVRRGARAVTAEVVERILSGADALRAQLRAISGVPADATPPLAGRQPEPAAAVAAEADQAFVKVDIAKLDELINLVGELAIAQSLVLENPVLTQSGDLSLSRDMRQLQRVSKALQLGATRLRMVPVRSLFRRMNRLVRDLSQQLGKPVQLRLVGEDTELDRHIVEKLADPLVHMIRNAIDHGIESQADRAARGKPAIATLTLSAGHRGGGVFIHLQDDGAGLDRQRILARAVARGLVSADAVPEDGEVHALIFQPGFSTAEQVTGISGRGVGMDIVRRNIESLRGRVEVDSSPGEGTRFRILLPLTLAIIDGLIVGVGERRYIVPTLAVRESFRPAPEAISQVHDRGELVAVRGQQMPVLRLDAFLGIGGRCQRPEEGILVVVESGEGTRAILVDELLGKQELVIKSLGNALDGQTLMAGGAVLGDGTVGLILDVDTLVRLQ